MSLRACLIVALLTLQSADVVLTWLLLTTRPDVGEANPLALAVLERHGWSGAVALKLASTAVAVGSVLLVSCKRPVLGRGLLVALCAVMGTVVGYSGTLLASPPCAEHDRMAASQRVSAALDREWGHLRALQRQRDGLCAGLLAGRLTLPQAVGQMTETLQESRPELSRRGQETWPRPERADEVARFLVSSCGQALRAAARAAVLQGLRQDLARHYPAPAPRHAAAAAPPGWPAAAALALPQ